MTKENKEIWEIEFDEKFPYLELVAFKSQYSKERHEKIKSFIRQLLQKARNEITPQYKKDMQDAYEKGKREAIKDFLGSLPEEKMENY